RREADMDESAEGIRQLARYQVRAEALPKVLAAIHEFVAYVKAKEAGTLRYEVLQEKEDPTRFVHIFHFKDTEAGAAHSQQAEVKKFAGILYPECLAPVEFVDYTRIATNREPSS